MSQATHQPGRFAGAGERHRLGLLVANLLNGAWREEEPAAKFSETELTEITPLLCALGAGALAWSRLRNTSLSDTASGRTLREVYRQSRLSALVHEREIVYVMSLLRREGIEPVLVKGWAVARRYPDRAVRPYGDIDLCVRADQFDEAARALKCLEEIAGHYVDLHCGFDRIGLAQRPTSKVQRQTDKVRTGSGSDRVIDDQHTTSKTQSRDGKPGHWTLDVAHWTTLYQRSQLVMLNGEPVRILSDEDHLRLLCQHLLRSGARRPSWLCDVGLIVEGRDARVESQESKVQSTPDVRREVSTGSGSDLVFQDQSSKTKDPKPETKAQRPNFDWSVCLGNDPVQANWIAAAIGLAHELLGANIDHTPFAAADLPRWLAPAVLQQWGGRVRSPVQSRKSKVESPFALRKLSTFDFRLLTNLYARWDNPIRATAAVGGEFNNWPRFPYRVAESIKRVSGL